MKKKILCVAMTMVMIVGVLSGCGKKNDFKNTEKEKVTESATEAVTNTEITTESATEAVTNTEITTESTEKKDDLLTITTSTICSRELYDFFKLYIGCYVDCFYKGNGGEPTNITNMIEKHKGVTGYLFTLNGMRVVSDYDDGYFGALYQPSGIRNTLMPFATKKDKAASVSYNCNVTCVKANFSSFKYKPQTDAELKLVVKVDWSCQGTYDHTGSDMFCVVLVNDSDNPAEWLLKAIYDVEDRKNGEYLVKGKGIKDNIEGLAFFDTKLIDEDKEVVDTTNISGWKKAYIDYFNNSPLNLSDYKYILEDVNSDNIPEIFLYGSSYSEREFYYINKNNEVKNIEFPHGYPRADNGYLYIGGGNMGYYYDNVSQCNANGDYISIFDGYYKEDLSGDTVSFKYYIGSNMEVSEDEYERKLSAYKDMKSFGEEDSNQGDIVSAIQNY